MTEDNKLPPALLIIFGITGDLSSRYLLPAIYSLFKHKRLHDSSEIIGITRGNTTVESLFEKIEASVSAKEFCDPTVLKEMRGHVQMRTMDLDNPADYSSLLEHLNQMETEKGLCLDRIYYLSIPPKAYSPVVELMGKEGLNSSCQHGKAATRLLVEKPFGFDANSAQNLLSETGKHFKEEQIFRVDHYLAKAGVNDFVIRRYQDKSLAQLWNANYIERIEVVAKEKIGIEGRATFYDSLGALRDFIQSHLVQIISLITMDRPITMNSQAVHAAKAKALNQIEAVPSDKVRELTRRGQYEGYKQEVNNPDSTTETFASVQIASSDENWRGVKFIMLTGKALNEKRTEIVVKFKVNSPEQELRFNLQGGNAYERVFIDAVKGDHLVFATKDEILASWRILQPVLDVWQSQTDDLLSYIPGSEGP